MMLIRRGEVGISENGRITMTAGANFIGILCLESTSIACFMFSASGTAPLVRRTTLFAWEKGPGIIIERQSKADPTQKMCIELLTDSVS